MKVTFGMNPSLPLKRRSTNLSLDTQKAEKHRDLNGPSVMDKQEVKAGKELDKQLKAAANGTGFKLFTKG